jgi:cobalamin-dependent methionine synthase I
MLVGERVNAQGNSVFLYHAVEAGLDLAIVNTKEVIPYAEISSQQRRLAEDLINYRREDALARYLAYFDEHGPAAGAREAVENPMEGMTAEEYHHPKIKGPHRVRPRAVYRANLGSLESQLLVNGWSINATET